MPFTRTYISVGGCWCLLVGAAGLCLKAFLHAGFLHSIHLKYLVPVGKDEVDPERSWPGCVCTDQLLMRNACAGFK